MNSTSQKGFGGGFGQNSNGSGLLGNHEKSGELNNFGAN